MLLAALLLSFARAASAAPAAAVTEPAAGALLAGTVNVSARVESTAAVAGVQFRLDGADLGARVNAPPYTISWNTVPAANGAHLLTAAAWDGAGSGAESPPVPVAVDNAPPSVALMNPAAGAAVSSTIMVSANAADNTGVAAVQFILDGSDLGGPVNAPPYAIAWNTTLVPDGPHTLAAVARDAAGNSATAVVTVSVANTPPAIGAPTIGAAAPNRVDVLWNTDQRSDSAAEFGPTPDYGRATPVISALGTGHGVSLTGLVPDTLYHYRVKSRNAAGVLSVSGDLTFTTPGAPPPAAVAPAAADDSSAKAPQKFLTPAAAGGINAQATFGPAALEVWIYDARGKLVFHRSSSGTGSPIVWNGKDASGRVVSSGVYIAKIRTRDARLTYQSFAIAK